MALFWSRWVKRTRDGRYDITLPDDVRDGLREYLEQLRDLLMTEDPLLRRLFPTAYPDDPERDRDYQRLMHGEILEARFAAIETMEATLDQRQVDEATLTAWMQSINALRLVIGTRLDVSEDHVSPDPDDPDYGFHVLYGLLSSLLGEIVHALTGALPPPTGDAAAPG